MFVKCQVKSDIDVRYNGNVHHFDFKTKDVSITFSKNRMVRNTINASSINVKIIICNYTSKQDPAKVILSDKWGDFNIASCI